jgi:hypothetical protein
MVRGIRNTSAEIGEDVTDKAGWMYADLFLALMVIFLATISFVPDLRTAPTSNSIVEGTSVASSAINKGAQIQYSVFDAEKLKADIDAYKKENGLTSSSAIIYVQTIGGFDAATQTVNEGTVTAVNFSLKMKNALPEYFNEAAFKIATDAGLSKNTVSLRLVFAS